jgi:hypothetical protein
MSALTCHHAISEPRSEDLSRAVGETSLTAGGRVRGARKTDSVAKPRVRWVAPSAVFRSGNQIRAADLLGVNRNILRKKIRDLDCPGDPLKRIILIFHGWAAPEMSQFCNSVV